MKAFVSVVFFLFVAKKSTVLVFVFFVFFLFCLPKKIASSLKSNAGPGKQASKSAAKSIASAVKTAAPKKTVKTAKETALPSKIAKRQSPTAIAKAAPVKKALPAAKAKTNAEKTIVDQIQSGASMSGNKTSVKSTDKIEKPEVSKVSEVATKTSKPIPDTATGGALLTEEQILKMSDKDYMNEAQLAFFRARLQQLEKDLLKNAGETTEHLRETVLVPDPADRATIEEEHALELRTRDRERKLLKKVQQSIASIDSGDYGWCEETGEPIGIPR